MGEKFDYATTRLVDAVRAYVVEKENPAPDMVMRNVEFGRMKAALRAWDAEHIERRAEGT